MALPCMQWLVSLITVAITLGLACGAEARPPHKRHAAAAASHSVTPADSDEALLKIVETTPGAVGLVDVYSITNRINVVKVDGKLPLEQGYLLR